MSQSIKQKRFRPNKVQELANVLARDLSASKLSLIEVTYALAAVLRGVGESTYDADSIEYEDVLEDYRKSPSWPAALILHADQIHRIYELFSQERSDPEVNKKAWKAHEEQINVDK